MGKTQFKDAIEFYTRGISAKCNNNYLNSILHSNRAAVNFELENYRSVLYDCEQAIKYDKHNIKAHYRSIKSLEKLDKFDQAIDCCEKAMLIISDVEFKAILERLNKKRLEKENNKYDHACFYIIRPKYNNFYMYVGHTINFENRLHQHIEKTEGDGDTKLYKTIRDTGGWDNWEMVKIDERYCKNKQDALKIEQDWCEKLRPNLNSKSPFA